VVPYNLWSARWDAKAKLMFCGQRWQENISTRRNNAQERRFKALVQEGYDLIGILDAEGNYTYVSTSTAILGITQKNL
jgi:hypothetical protein